MVDARYRKPCMSIDENTQSRRSADGTRDRLREAGRKAFAERDYGAVTLSGVARAAGFTPPIGAQHFGTVDVLFSEVYRAASDAELRAVQMCFKRAAGSDYTGAAQDLIDFYKVPCRVRYSALAMRDIYPMIAEAYFDAFDERLEAAMRSAPSFDSVPGPARSVALAEIEAAAQLFAAPASRIDGEIGLAWLASLLSFALPSGFGSEFQGDIGEEPSLES